MDITASGTKPKRRGAAEWFTGTDWQDPVVEAPAPARIRAARVSFEPGARTAPTTGMIHQAIQESLDDVHVVWLERVSDKEHAAALAA